MAHSHLPQRIVALSSESAEFLHVVGAWNRVVGVTGFFRQPRGVASKPKISGFDRANVGRIVNLKPDLVITYCDVQAEITAELIKAGLTVLATNQRMLKETASTLRLLGRAVGEEIRAEKVVKQWERAVCPVRVLKKGKCRPRVYFEEWPEPMVCGIGWVSELIEAAGGDDIFKDRRGCRASRERGVTREEILARAPDVIFASWCGKKVNRESIRRREGWEAIPAVQEERIHEIPSDDILSPGLGVVRGLERMKTILGELK